MRRTTGLLALLSLVGGCAKPEPGAATDASVGTAEVNLDAWAPPVPLPAGGEDWDYVGTFRLAEDEQSATVRLYVYDSDSVADKEAKRGELSLHSYPSFFALHAFYRVGAGEWAHREVYSLGRTGFVRVVGQAGGAVSLELRRAFRSDLTRDSKDDLERVRQANKPYTIRLTLKEGVPVAEPVPAEP